MQKEQHGWLFPSAKPKHCSLLIPHPQLIQPHLSVADEGADLPDYVLTEADSKLDKIYSNHIHNNPSTCLSGGIADDALWQRCWKQIVNIRPRQYLIPQNCVGKMFLEIFCKELCRVQLQRWNSKYPLVFVAVILQEAHRVKTASDIQSLLEQQINHWDARHYGLLIDNLIAQACLLCNGPTTHKTDDDELLLGQIRGACRNLTSCNGGGVLIQMTTAQRLEGWFLRSCSPNTLLCAI